ncbi:Zn-dependent M28 family amino/carboxypeptidase [Actinorugispora endophytica]|uniref:Zn-dependent M28 family amino/carboxypeptidase n=1 Tax=Actinorugispora endophytica TaxID=1605990 RepID=A0A4R6ULN0_9ACTN|nr:Zn-dependent M28 family amino/carboxypeptidase [Actinorugispora endophytica]
MKSGLAAGVSAVMVLGLGLAPAANASTTTVDEAALPGLVTTDAIREHMRNLATIAEYNGGNRATGTPGYDVAAKYVIDQLKRAGYKPVKHTYTFDEWIELSDAVLSQTAPEAREFAYGEDFLTMEYSGPGDVTATAVPVDAQGSDSGCEADDFAGFPTGSIAVLKRGTCTFEQKAANAAEAGAAGAVIFNHGATEAPGDTGPVNGTVTNPSAIPTVGASVEVGEALLAAGADLELRLRVDSEIETSTSYNIVAETRGGKKDNVVVVGAHLDGVEEGPGINDNGSGVAAILEVARQLPRLGTPENKVRFAFWGSEEVGLIGSTEYVESLSDKELERIALYLNFDMIGSENYARLVYDGRNELPGSAAAPSGSGAIQKTFEDYFAAEGLVVEPTEFSGRSDYRAFMLAGIPAGGLFSGADGIKTEEQVEYYGGTAGVQYDRNYHTADDTFENINWDSVTELSGGIAYSVETFSENTLPVNGVAPFRAGPQSAGAFDRVSDRWVR